MKILCKRQFYTATLIAAGIFAISSVSLAGAVTSQTKFLFDPVNSNPPRTCTLDNNVVVVAGEGNDATAAFPKTVIDPSSTLLGSYLKWDYTFTYPTSQRRPEESDNISSSSQDNEDGSRKPSKLYLTVSNDTPIFSTSPSVLEKISTNCDTKNGATCESQVLKFPASSSTGTSGQQYTVSFITPMGYTPRIATAGAQRHGDNSNNAAFCLIAGASKQDSVNVATVESKIVSTPGCRVDLETDSSGRVSNATIISGSENCHIDHTPAPFICDNENGVATNCKKVVSNLPENGLTSEGSCNYSYTNTSGGKTTLACTTCCVQASTNTCVLKSSLSSLDLCTAATR